MSGFITLECKYCGNASRSSFVLRDGEYICKCCGRAYRENATGTEARSVMGFETLKNYDFEAAENIFTDIISEFPDSVDARWGLLLARYGIVFVKGFYTGDIEPIYCFPNYSYSEGAFTEEPEYVEIENLLKNDSERMSLYRKQAEQIEAAFKAFKSDAGKKENDVFICVKISKTTANNPFIKGTTEDYEKACELYEKLRQEGKRVFFSYVTLKNTIDSDMTIWRNLLKSKKMLLIGSRTEYLNSVWVKSEWERWLWLDNAGVDEHRKNLYIYILGGENENLYGKLPAGLRKLHPQIYTESTETDLVNDICHGDEPKKEKKAKPEKATKSEKAPKPEKEPRPKKEPKPGAANDDGARTVPGIISPIIPSEKPKPEKAPKPKKEPKPKPEKAPKPKKEPKPKPEKAPKPPKKPRGKDGYVEFLDGRREKIPFGSLSAGTYSGRSDVVRVVLPKSVTYIEANNFSNCTNLVSISIPKSVTSIGMGAFEECTKLASVEIPKGITEISMKAFYNCSSLSHVKLPQGLHTIGSMAFEYCGSLKEIELPHTLSKIEYNAFNHAGLRELSLPRAVLSVGDWAFYGCEKLGKVFICDTVSEIGRYAFDSNTKIIYQGTEAGFGQANKAGTYYKKLVCKNESSIKRNGAMTAIGIFIMLLAIASAVGAYIYVPGSLHWCIAIAGGIVLNILLGIISLRTSDEVYATVNGIELVAFFILFFMSIEHRVLMIYALGVAIGALIVSIYKTRVKSEYGWIYLLLNIAALALAIFGLIFAAEMVLAFLIVIGILGFVGYLIYAVCAFFS